MRQMRRSLLEDNVVKREGLADMVEQRKLVDDFLFILELVNRR